MDRLVRRRRVTTPAPSRGLAHAAYALRDFALAVAALATLAWAGCSEPTPVEPPTGGTRYVYSYEGFVQDVAPVLIHNGCDAGGDCHGGGLRGTLELSPRGSKDHRFDFAQVVQQVRGDRPVSSPLLTKPLSRSEGGDPHAVEPFPSRDDPGYTAILRWIEAGVAQ